MEALRAIRGAWVKQRVFGAGVLFGLLVLAAAPGHTQTVPPPSSPPPPAQATQPVTGFVSPYEIMRRVRGSGFDPLAPPLREGTDYVLRATDFRGILMRIVVDAHSGAIRDVTRIVPGPGRYGQFYPEPPYSAADLEAPTTAPSEARIEPPSLRPPAARPAPTPSPTVMLRPPLPRPRPAALASRRPDAAISAPTSPPIPDAKTETKSESSPGAGAAVIAKPAGAPDANSQINSEVITTAPPPAPAAPNRAPRIVEPVND
jgi:hypothetical protein